MARAKAKILDLFRAFADLKRSLIERMLHPYRPELHYMRGPGPRCRAKQDLPQI
jgi:hypothetical protein